MACATDAFAIGRHGAVGRLLDADRLHLQHGPIDLVVRAWGSPGEVARARGRAIERFADVLTALVGELPRLRDAATGPADVAGVVAQRMVAAVSRFDGVFVTPMAAVAGAVADEILACVAPGIERAYVNNGGDIACVNTSDEPIAIGIADDPERGRGIGRTTITIRRDDGVGGIATSGWRGRSHSFGIADRVTVLARDAAGADAAATLVANAVDVDSDAIRRRPAEDVFADSDLGARAITVSVGRLTDAEIDAALSNGARVAHDYVARGAIIAAHLVLGRHSRTVGGAERMLLRDVSGMRTRQGAARRLCA